MPSGGWFDDLYHCFPILPLFEIQSLGSSEPGPDFLRSLTLIGFFCSVYRYRSIFLLGKTCLQIQVIHLLLIASTVVYSTELDWMKSAAFSVQNSQFYKAPLGFKWSTVTLLAKSIFHTVTQVTFLTLRVYKPKSPQQSNNNSNIRLISTNEWID